MAEYLDPRDGYSLVTLPDWKAPEPWLIEVPEGATTATIDNDGDLYFWKMTEECLNPNNAKEWFHPDKSIFEKFEPKTIWQRATLPEELPFIDDEPPAHFVVRPKPRERVYAVLGDQVTMTPDEAFKSFASLFCVFWRDFATAAKKLRDEGKL